MSNFRFSYRCLLTFFLKLTLFVFLLSSLGVLELFKDGGARYQGVTQTTYDGWLTNINDIYLMLMLLCFFMALVVQKRWVISFLSNKCISLIFLYPLLLSLYLFFRGFDFSIDILKISILFCSSMVFSCLLVFFLKEEEFFLFLHKLFFVLLVVSCFLILFIPSYGIQIDDRAAWQGVFSHKNHLGVFCVLAAIFYGLKDKSMRLPYINYIIAAILVFGSKSYTSILCFCFVSFLYALPSCGKYILYKYRYRFVFLFLLLSFLLVYISIFSSDIKFLDKDLSFSSRNLIWLYAFHQLGEINVFGRGLNYTLYENSFDVTPFYNATGQALASFHNGFISSVYELGVFGFILFYLLFLPLKKVKNGSVKYLYPFFLYSLSYTVINTFESIGIGFNFYFFLLIYFSLVQFKKDIYWR